MNLMYSSENEKMLLRKYEITLLIQPNKKGGGYRILQNSVKIYYDLLGLKEEHKKRENYDLINELNNYKKVGEIIQECCEIDGEITESFKGDYTEEKIERLKIQKDLFISRSKLIKGETLLLIAYLPISYLFQLTGGEKIKIYDFNPKTLKSASFINKQNILEEDGSNIANVIQRILKNSEDKKRFLLVLKKLMPFIEDISTEKSFNKSMYFRVMENNQNNLPSALLSDGTVNIIAIIVALFFEKNNDVVIIEEPEKNIHPKLTNQLVTLMKDVGNNKQIIITTHNTQLLASVQLKDIIYVYRNKKRFSTIERPINNKQVNEFIKNDLEIGDLFYEGLFTDKEE
jgi:ABC-type dipeptide/oligopeptide/nickel transport system ATPase component